MPHDPTARLDFGRPHLDACLEATIEAVFRLSMMWLSGGLSPCPCPPRVVSDRMELPDSGWDGVIRWAHQDRALGQPVQALSALDITLLPSHWPCQDHAAAWSWQTDARRDQCFRALAIFKMEFSGFWADD